MRILIIAIAAIIIATLVLLVIEANQVSAEIVLRDLSIRPVFQLDIIEF